MACSSICPSSSPTFGPNTARRCQAGTARPRCATPRTTVARLTGAITALMQRDRTHHRRKVSFTSGARTAHAAILPLDRGRVSRVGDAGSPAPYSCPCLTPVSARPSPAMPLAPTHPHQSARVPRVVLPSRVLTTGVAIAHPRSSEMPHRDAYAPRAAVQRRPPTRARSARPAVQDAGRTTQRVAS